MTPIQIQLCKMVVQGEADQIETFLTIESNQKCITEEDEIGFSPALFCLAIMYHTDPRAFAKKLQLFSEPFDSDNESALNVVFSPIIRKIIQQYLIPNITIENLLQKIADRINTLQSTNTPLFLFWLECVEGALDNIPKFDESHFLAIMTLHRKLPAQPKPPASVVSTASAAAITQPLSKYNEAFVGRSAYSVLPKYQPTLKPIPSHPEEEEEDTSSISAAAANPHSRARALSGAISYLPSRPSPLRNIHSGESTTSESVASATETPSTATSNVQRRSTCTLQLRAMPSSDQEPLNDRRPPYRKKK